MILTDDDKDLLLQIHTETVCWNVFKERRAVKLIENGYISWGNYYFTNPVLTKLGKSTLKLDEQT